MIKRNPLALYLEELLGCSRFQDYAPNGLQVEGKEQIKRICTAVTASEEVITAAVAWQADVLLVHHGYFWRGEEPCIVGMKRKRIMQLLTHEINLFAYHLPLDCHLELGNNACLATLLGVKEIKTHKVGSHDHLLWSGQLIKPMPALEFKQVLHTIFGRTPLHINAHTKPIHQIAWCTGGAQDYIEQANALGVDAYISGEVSERTYYQAKELGIDYFSCGHHATERYGIQALGEHLAQRFSLEHQFIDSNNPI